MCGIVGLVNFDGQPVHKVQLRRMWTWLRHRGPDEQGAWTGGPIGIATARLSIIDLVSGKQPIPNEDKSIWVSFNGEIYNFRDLRRELEGRGHQFQTGTDTEVIVHAYEEWGEDFATHLKGMFGLALVDTRAGRLYLARDPVGEKPLFYTTQQGFFAFASEIKPLLHALPVSRDIEPLAIESFFAFSRPVGPLCAFRSIRKLMPGQMLRLDIATRQVQITTYWHPPCDTLLVSSEEAEETLQSLLVNTIPRYLTAHVPVGAFLSGGTDSAGVVAMMQRFVDEPVKTFTAVYKDPYISEASEASQVARYLGTEHREVPIEPSDVLRVLPMLIWHFEEPFADASFIPTYFVSRRARDFVKVALTGDGGDELFGGYDSYFAWRVLEHYRCAPRAIRAAGALAAHGIPLALFTRYPRLYHYAIGARRIVRAAKEQNDVAAFLSMTGDTSLGALLPEQTMEELLSLRQAALHGYEAKEPLARILYFQFRGLLPELFFTKVDRASMANSLECRSPLVYQDIVEFALRLPVSLKVRGKTRKYLLKRVLTRFLPREILYRPKKGFSIPFYRWLREDAALRRLVEYYTLQEGSRLLREHTHLNCQLVTKVSMDYLEGKHNNWVLPWKVVCFGLWWNTFVSRDGREPVTELHARGRPGN